MPRALLLACLLAAAAPAWAQQAPVPATSELSAREVTVGEEFSINVELPSGVSGGGGEVSVTGLPEGVVAVPVTSLNHVL